jgi:hypothetical protein
MNNPGKPQWSAGRRAVPHSGPRLCLLIEARQSEMDAPFGAPLPLLS